MSINIIIYKKIYICKLYYILYYLHKKLYYFFDLLYVKIYYSTIWIGPVLGSKCEAEV